MLPLYGTIIKFSLRELSLVSYAMSKTYYGVKEQQNAKLLDNFLLFRDFQTNTGMFKLPCIHLITLAGNHIVGFSVWSDD